MGVCGGGNGRVVKRWSGRGLVVVEVVVIGRGKDAGGYCYE